VAFLGAIFTNMKTLQYANVETFIVFRSSTPLLIALLDYAFLGRELPSLRSWCSLLLLLCGAIGYVMYDANFEVRRSGVELGPATPAAGRPVIASCLEPLWAMR
jgi:solute carrier family 35 protein